MQELAALVGIIAALSVGVVSPGPSFVMVARVAVASSRSQAFGAALGMGAGGVLFGAAALLGLQSIFHAVPVVYAGLKVLGGLYLLLPRVSDLYFGQTTAFRHGQRKACRHC